MCANKIDKPVGQVTYSPLLNANGKLVADLIVVRRAAQDYLLITSTLHGQHDLAWLRLHATGDVQLRDVTMEWTGVAVWGPQAQTILQGLTAANLSKETFAYYTMQTLTVADIPTLALNMSFVGERGWELHVQHQHGAALWDAIWEAGQEHGLVAVGSVALDSLSKEKGYVIYGNDITSDDTPHEARLGWTVKRNGIDFIGRAALEQANAAGLQRKRCTLVFTDPDGFAMGGEPVFFADDCIGYVTSANGGYSIGKHIAYAYLPIAHSKAGTQLHVDYFGQRYNVVVTKQPLV